MMVRIVAAYFMGTVFGAPVQPANLEKCPPMERSAVSHALAPQTHLALRLAILTVWASIETLNRDRKLNPKSPSTPSP